MQPLELFMLRVVGTQRLSRMLRGRDLVDHRYGIGQFRLTIEEI